MNLYKTIQEDFYRYSYIKKGNFFIIIYNVILYATVRAVFLFRISNYLDGKKWYFFAFIFEKLMHITTITWIGRRARIKPGFVIRHVGSIVVGGKSEIGYNCEIRQGVTLGGNLGKEKDGRTQPILGNNILIGAGAKILGPVKIGDNSIIGANAVVICDIPENSVAGGVPARVLRQIKLGENPLIKSH